MTYQPGELGAAAKELADALAEVKAYRRDFGMPSQTTTNNTPTINVNAGGVGVWIATTCCLICLAVGLIGSLWVSREFTKRDAAESDMREQISKMNSYLSAIYMQAPHLKPKDK